MVRKVLKLNAYFLLSLFVLGLSFAQAKPKKRSQPKQEKIPKALPVVEDTVRFKNEVELPVAPLPHADPALPDFGENEDSYGVVIKDNASFFRVPETIRQKREIARRRNLKKAQFTLFDYIVVQREKLFPKEHDAYVLALRNYQDFLVEVFFQKSSEEQKKMLEAKFEKSPELKASLTYFGLIRLHGVHGYLGTLKQVEVPRAILASLSTEGLQSPAPAPSVTEEFVPAPKEVLDAQVVEAAYHRFVPTGKRYDPYRDFVGKFAANGVNFNFSPMRTNEAAAEIRSIGLDLIWDLKERILPEKAAEIEARYTELRKKYAPYDRIYIDVFKQNAMAAGSPEFLAIWRSRDSETRYRRELLGLGLITTGKREDTRWLPVGEKGAPGNTPDGVWKVFGFDKYYVSRAGDDMRGLVQLSYADRKGFSGRGFHLVFFSSPWGTNASHGCFRVYTGADARGLANVIWAAINPLQLNNVDYTDFGNDSDNDRNKETQSVREVVRYIRENVWVTNFSEHADGFSFTGKETYSAQIRQQYTNHRAVSGVSVLDAAKKLYREGAQTIVGPSFNNKNGTVNFLTHKGQYWIYDKETRLGSFNVNLQKAKN